MKNTQRFLFTPELIAQCEEEDILDHVLNTLPDEKLLCKFQFQRKGKRDDYPIRTMWAILWAEACCEMANLDKFDTIYSILEIYPVLHID